MVRKQYVLFTISTSVVFLLGLGLGLSISQGPFGSVVKVQQGGSVAVQNSFGRRAHLSHDIITELARLNSEMQDAEEISQGMLTMLFSDNGGPLQVSIHPDILDILVLLKKGDGQINYAPFFQTLEEHEDRFGKTVFRHPRK